MMPTTAAPRTLASAPRPGPLDAAQRRMFFDEGYLVLPRFFDDAAVDAVNDAVDRAWADRSIYNTLTISAFTGSSRYTETYVRKVDPEARSQQHKLNHLYLYDHRVLTLLLAEPLQAILRELLGGTPLLFNGLNMEQGTEQRFHIDSFYMPPRTFGRMVAIWIALEDIHPDSGPLSYYPGSHLIPPYRFSHGEIWAIADEMPAFDAYYERELAVRGLEPRSFCPRKGDMFIWHAQLYHAGGAIADRTRTRKSMVAHFWTAEDYPDMALEPSPGRFILDRRYMCVPPNFVA